MSLIVDIIFISSVSIGILKVIDSILDLIIEDQQYNSLIKLGKKLVIKIFNKKRITITSSDLKYEDLELADVKI